MFIQPFAKGIYYFRLVLKLGRPPLLREIHPLVNHTHVYQSTVNTR